METITVGKFRLTAALHALNRGEFRAKNRNFFLARLAENPIYLGPKPLIFNLDREKA